MPGVVELAEQVFDLPVRLGLPHEVQGLKDVVRNPACATAVGLLMYGRQNQPSAPVLPTQGVGRWLHRINDWIDRKSVVEGKRVSVRFDFGGRRTITKKKQKTKLQ